MNSKRKATKAYWEVSKAWNLPTKMLAEEGTKPMTLEKALKNLNFAKESGGLVAKMSDHLIHQIVHKNVDYPPVEQVAK